MISSRKAVIVSISGASSSGKTSLCRLLRNIFPNTFTLHEDDFFKPDKEIPLNDDGIQDWDCDGALSLQDIVESLIFIRKNGAFPPNLDSLANKNAVSENLVTECTIAALKAKVTRWSAPGKPGHIINNKKICLFDGFLLYSHQTSTFWPYLDLKIFLQVSHDIAKARRMTRGGYPTIEGFWQDPPNYMDQVVWPNYCRNHEWMFKDGDVEGKLLEKIDVLGEICWQGKADVDMEKTLTWAVELLMNKLPELLKDIE